MDLRTILNGGFGKDGTYSRLVQVKGGAFEPKHWPTFGPKMLAGIGRTVPDTVRSRAVQLRLERMERGTLLEKARDRAVSAVSEPLRARIAAMAAALGELPYVDDPPEALSLPGVPQLKAPNGTRSGRSEHETGCRRGPRSGST
jgi:hypothetical protein